MRNLAMLALLFNLLATLRSALRTRTDLALENLAFRQPLTTCRPENDALARAGRRLGEAQG